MLVKVLKKFRDKNTREVIPEGKIINITKDRYEEILKVGSLVEEVKTKKAKAEK